MQLLKLASIQQNSTPYTEMSFFRDLFRKIPSAKPDFTGSPSQASIHDPVYGILEWEPDPGWWVGRYVCPGSGEFRLLVDPTDNKEREPNAELRTFYMTIQSQIVQARDMAIDDFLPTFNSGWNEGEPLTKEEFSQLIKPENVHIWDYGSIEVSYQEADDNECLGGHSLVVSFHTDGSTTIGLEG